MAYSGVNPQGYHGINFGSFVPKPSFKVRQLAASNSRRDTTIGTAADREDYHFIRQQHRDAGRLRGYSLPEIKVKRLLNKPKKKHSGAHTVGGASSEKLRFPVIVPTANANPDAPRRGAHDQWTGENGHDGSRGRRVVRNGEPWWKWSRRHHDDDEQTGKNHSHKQRLPQIENLSAQLGVKNGSKQRAKRVQHNLRQKLPSLLGYKDDNGNLVFSEAENNVNTRGNGYYTYDSRNVFMNRRYYYSYSRDGIRPCRPEAKVSNACLYDLSNLQPTNPDYASHQEAMITSMHDDLQTVSGVLPLHGLHTKNTGGSNLGAKVKQSLNRDRERNAKKWKRQPVVINIDSSYAADSELEEEEEEQATTAAPVPQHPKTLNQNHLRALAILQELINILNSTEFVPGSEYSSNEAGSVSEIPTLSQINLGDFFQKPESVIKQYDRFKNITRSTHHPQSDDTSSAQQVELERKESHRKAEKDRFGLTQLMAVHRLQTESSENLSGVDFNNVATKLTTRAYDSQNMDKVKSSNENFKSTSTKRGEFLGDKTQYPELAELLAVQQLQALNDNVSSFEVSDESKNISKPTHSDEIGVRHHPFTQKSKCDIQTQLVCVDLNDQFLQLSNDGPRKQFLKRHLSNRKSVHNVSKLLLVEPAEKQQNPRPDLEISGENLKHLYNLGLLDRDQELSQLAVKG
jgi:hypothetical protein